MHTDECFNFKINCLNVQPRQLTTQPTQPTQPTQTTQTTQPSTLDARPCE